VSGVFPGRVFPVWEQARDLFQKMLSDSGTYLYETGDLVMRAATLYAHADREGARELEVAATFESQQKLYDQKPLDRVPDPQTRATPLPPS